MRAASSFGASLSASDCGRRDALGAAGASAPCAATVRRRLVVGTFALLGAACGGARAPAAPTPLRVFAAASLAQPFAALAEAAPDDARPRLSFAGSAQLALQLQQGAQACVFASADAVTMHKVVAAGLAVGEPAVFARNRLAIAVPAGNPKGVRGLADLARRDLVVLLGAPDVPAGRYARQALQRAGVAVIASSDEPSVRAIVGKVQAGEADAGIVYRTDCAVAGVTGVPLDPAHDVVAECLVVALTSAADPARALAFVERLRGDVGRRILARHGFELP